MSHVTTADDLCAMVSAIQAHEECGAAFIAEPQDLLLGVRRQTPGLGINHVEYEQLSITKPDEL